MKPKKLIAVSIIVTFATILALMAVATLILCVALAVAALSSWDGMRDVLGVALAVLVGTILMMRAMNWAGKTLNESDESENQ